MTVEQLNQDPLNLLAKKFLKQVKELPRLEKLHCLQLAEWGLESGKVSKEAFSVRPGRDAEQVALLGEGPGGGVEVSHGGRGRGGSETGWPGIGKGKPEPGTPGEPGAGPVGQQNILDSGGIPGAKGTPATG